MFLQKEMEIYLYMLGFMFISFIILYLYVFKITRNRGPLLVGLGWSSMSQSPFGYISVRECVSDSV